ncbi:MAG: YraN family protein [Leptolyngbyaceae cyanobacterium]
MTDARPSPRASRQTMGEWGEVLVSQWLQQLGWQILAQRWRCRWGELDIVAQAPRPTPMLIVVEVKVRNRGNWDQAGLLAITPQKQRRLIQATELFLAEHEEFANAPCRFDLALVQRKPGPKENSGGQQGSDRPSAPVPKSPLQQGAAINHLERSAIASFLGLASAPTQAIQAAQIPFVCVGHELLKLHDYLEGAFEI